MKTFIYLFIFFIKYSAIQTLSCYQCSMKYSNGECNANNSTYFTECQPTYDTCLTMVLKPGILDELIITKYCTKRQACERQRDFTHAITPCQPNKEGRSWGCVSCCGDRDLCNYDHSNRFSSNTNLTSLLFIALVYFFFIYNP